MTLIIFIIAFWVIYRSLVFKSNFGKKVKLFTPFYFRYFWNAVLLLTFLPTVATSLLLYFGQRSSFLLYWHNQLGIIFVVVGVLHFLERIKYFTKI